MEIMNLKPSFARKLNQQGLSLIHLAVQNGHKEIVLRFLDIDKDLVRVKGKQGETPLHYISKVGHSDVLLDRFLVVCPDCIRDVTTQNCTSLHIAVKNKRFDVLQVLIRMLRKRKYYREVMNQKDEDGNTALHIAASSNQLQVLELLLENKADKHVTNQDGLTALDLAYQHNTTESINNMGSCFCSRVSDFKYKLKKQIISHTTMASSLFSYDTDNISSDDRNALLVILGLLLAVTYQATLSPPSGVLPDQSSSTSVVQQTLFLMFYIPTYIVFLVAFFLTLALLKPFPCGFRTALQTLLAFLCNRLRPINMSDSPSQTNIYTYDDIFDNFLGFDSTHV